MLYKSGFLHNKTLLIIDEPETHLHPQWVVEYARLIVLLNKELGVKFFIASHHPDMISAIKYISEKEKTSSILHFYLAEKTDGSFEYEYKDLGTDIEGIFSSFNIAFERIDLYGATE
jgi:predicted ATP-dependent endonuclease of OLD family